MMFMTGLKQLSPVPEMYFPCFLFAFQAALTSKDTALDML